MNDKVNYFKLLFESGQNLESFSEKLSDFFPGLVYVYDLENGQLKYVNKNLTDILGYSCEDLIDSEDVWSNLVFKEDIDLVKKELEKFHSIAEDQSLAYGCRLNQKNGSCRYFKTIGTVLRRNEIGRPISALFIANDITDQLKTKEESKAISELFKETEDILKVGSWSWDINTDQLDWTQGMYNLLEYSREAFPTPTNALFLEYVIEGDRERLSDAIESALKGKDGFEQEYLIRTKTGKQKNVFTKAKVISNKEGIVSKVIGITRDITSIKNLEKEQERIFKELNRSNRELEEFAYVASHDLQEPLRKISTFNERLKTKFANQLGDDGNIYLDRIFSSTESMRLLIDNLLEFSRVTRSSESYTTCDLNLILKEVLSDLELKIEETNTIVELTNLPFIEAVPLEMKQLFTNLISNAIKFRKQGTSPIIEIKSEKFKKADQDMLHLFSQKDYVKIEIQDNGIGFENEYSERIFQIFQRLHGKTAYKGSGIGLAICKKIVDNHDGVIFAQGSPSVGALFTIILPEKQIV
jgi:PAS domain S-box-containing protein